MRKLFAFFLLFAAFVNANAQDLFSNNRRKYIVVSSDTLQLDSLSIIPQSLILTDTVGNVLAADLYQVNPEGGQVILSEKLRSESTFNNTRLVANYKVFPFLFSRTYQHKDSKVFQPDESGRINPFVYTGEENKKTDFFASEGLNKSGSISRGVAFGNNQDVVLNSNLNLQLSGKLTDKISILAAIADDNIPIQPEGNTQQLQEFDRVFIQFNDDKSKLIAGDFQLTRPNSYFLNYFKKSQGVSFSSAFGLGESEASKKNNTMAVSLSAAVSKGKFSRNVIIGVEGNQGPYRLRGAENESYVIILSGSEKVYIDGQLMERGQDNDYIIDYNTAEITFTPKRIITKDKRITAEFQYSDKNYARSLYDLGDEYKNKKLALRFHFFSEQDNKKKPLLQELKPSEKQLLDSIGDNLSQALVPSIDTTGYLPNTILYKSVDSLGFSNVFVYSTDSANAKYRLSFSNVGLGNGDYNPASTAANGKVYEWIAPVNGVKQGSYEPKVLLITPKKKQMLTFGADYQISRNFTSSIELAYSKNDINTFSGKNYKDDDGYGLRFLLLKRTPLSTAGTDTVNLITGANLELVSKYFSPIERYRSVEFERDWNRTSTQINNDQTIAGAKIGVEKKSVGNFIYHFTTFQERANYTGIQHFVTSDAHAKGYALTTSASLLNSSGKNNKTSYLKYKALASKNIQLIKVGAGIEEEQSKFQNDNFNVLGNSFHFLEWQAFVQSVDTLKNAFKIKYLNRTDWLPDSTRQNFKRATGGQSIAADLALARNENSVFKISGTYRKLSIYDKALTQEPDNSLVARVEHDLKLFKGAVSTSTFYEVGSGLEVKKEFSFIKVPAGQGVYLWNDLNQDSLQTTNEFFVAAPGFQDKAEYLKVFTPTNDYVKTYNNQFSEILNLSPSNVWGNKTGFKKFISLLSNQTAYRIDRKTSSKAAEKFLNPFLNQTKDSAIVTLNSSFRNTFFFNRFNSKFGFDYSYQENKSKSLLVNGAEQRSNIFHNFKIRWNVTRKWLISNEATDGIKFSSSQFFSSQDYRIVYVSTEPKLSFQPNVSFRATLSYEYSDKKNTLVPEDSTRIESKGQKLGIEVKYNKAQQGSLSAKFNYILFTYNGVPNSSLSYEMLEGLQPGNNYTWNLTYQRTLSNNIQLNLSYDGRKSDSGNGRIVHIGNVQVRAYF
jgi:hypothetical protein